MGWQGAFEFLKQIKRKQKRRISNSCFGRWEALGLALNIGLRYAKKGMELESYSLEKVATEGFLNFLIDTTNPNKIIYCGDFL